MLSLKEYLGLIHYVSCMCRLRSNSENEQADLNLCWLHVIRLFSIWRGLHLTCLHTWLLHFDRKLLPPRFSKKKRGYCYTPPPPSVCTSVCNVTPLSSIKATKKLSIPQLCIYMSQELYSKIIFLNSHF